MRNKLIYCIPLALSITCLIGCAAKAAQMPAEPEPVALLPEQKQSSIVMHALRHTYATRAIEYGMPPKTLQKLLGHASIKTTMDRYVHVTEDFMLNAVQIFESKGKAG